jgi:hypothetical protein
LSAHRAGRSSGVNVSLFQSPWKSGSPHGVRSPASWPAPTLNDAQMTVIATVGTRSIRLRRMAPSSKQLATKIPDYRVYF